MGRMGSRIDAGEEKSLVQLGSTLYAFPALLAWSTSFIILGHWLFHSFVWFHTAKCLIRRRTPAATWPGLAPLACSLGVIRSVK